MYVCARAHVYVCVCVCVRERERELNKVFLRKLICLVEKKN